MDNNDTKNPRIAKLVIVAGVSLMVATFAYLGIDISEDVGEDVAQVAAVATPPCSGRCLPSYCERWPAYCQECREPPCGEPIGLVCCDFGCFAVENYADCTGDLFWCEYGFQGIDPDGKPYVLCYDE